MVELPSMAAFNSFSLKDLNRVRIIDPKSHKGDNGKILVIGGSSLFHSASIWAAELAAHFVDHVFYYSPTHINREILVASKQQFRDGFIVDSGDLENYIEEANVILLGPGLRRQDVRARHPYSEYMEKIGEIERISDEPLQSYMLTNTLLKKYPQKKWVIDAGALQEAELEVLSPSCILTPHQQEFGRLFPEYAGIKNFPEKRLSLVFSDIAHRVTATWLIKKQGVDYVVSTTGDITSVSGGNEGLIKGGTGDLLSALVAVLYVKNPAQLAASAASYILKEAAQDLYKTHGPYYTTTELSQTIPQVVWRELSKNRA